MKIFSSFTGGWKPKSSSLILLQFFLPGFATERKIKFILFYYVVTARPYSYIARHRRNEYVLRTDRVSCSPLFCKKIASARQKLNFIFTITLSPSFLSSVSSNGFVRRKYRGFSIVVMAYKTSYFIIVALWWNLFFLFARRKEENKWNFKLTAWNLFKFFEMWRA